MHKSQVSASQRAMLEVELRRAGGRRAVAAMAVLGLVTLIGVGAISAGNGDGAAALSSEWAGFEAPASVDEAFRQETVAVAPATGQHEKPELIVNNGMHG